MGAAVALGLIASAWLVRQEILDRAGRTTDGDLSATRAIRPARDARADASAPAPEPWTPPVEDKVTAAARAGFPRTWGQDETPQSPPFDVKAQERFRASRPAEQQRFVVRLRARYFQPIRTARIRFTAPTHRVYLQFQDIPSPAQQRELAALGVKLDHFVTDYTYVADVRLEGFAALMRLPFLRGAADILPIDKLSESLAAGQPAEWAVTETGACQLTVKFAPETPIAEALAALSDRVQRILTPEYLYGNRLNVEADPAAALALAEPDRVDAVAEVPPPATDLNVASSALSKANLLWDAPYSLDGTGVRVGEWDGGQAAAGHGDFGGRVTVVEARADSAHATHVAGTIIGSGAGSAAARGYANAARLWSWTYDGDIVTEQATGKSTYALALTNNSWGYSTGSSYYGLYSIYSAEWDAMINDTGLLVVKAAGNSGSGFDTIDTGSAAKHVLTVGALDDSGTVAGFSSRGPCNDGRVKPDISANGVGLTSPVPGGGYASYSGTSMACPSTSGSITLLTQYYRTLFGGADPSPNLIRALLCHTAVDRGNAGPDYLYGFGLVDAQAAADLLADDALPAVQRIFTGSVAHGDEITYVVSAPTGATELKATLSWFDPAGSTAAANAIVNDLDLWLTGPDSTDRLPFSLDKAAPSAPATTSGANRIDVVEQVRVATPAAGTWIVHVKGYAVPSGPQTFVLLLSGGSVGSRSIHGQITGDAAAIAGVRMDLVGGAIRSGLTNAAGQYTFDALADSLYTVKPTKVGVAFSPESRDVTLSGSDVTDVDFAATALESRQYTRDEAPDLAIPDNNPTGITSILHVPDGGTLRDLRVYVDLTHTYIGDLVLTLTSPVGTVVTLHNRTGGATDNILGWYDTDRQPAGSLDTFHGEDPEGDWLLTVSDHGAGDTGRLNLWRLEIWRVPIPPAPPGTIALTPASLAFAGPEGGPAPAAQSLLVGNSGVLGSEFAWSATADRAWVTLTPASGVQGEMLDVTVNPAGLARGTHTATITFASAKATNAPQTAGVTFVVGDIVAPAAVADLIVTRVAPTGELTEAAVEEAPALADEEPSDAGGGSLPDAIALVEEVLDHEPVVLTAHDLRVGWTAPGDDGFAGTATVYDLRYSTAPITDANWDVATPADGEPAPRISGTVQECVVSGLVASTTYYFGLKTRDEVGNESPLSNIASGTTDGEPDLTPPAAISDLAARAAGATHQLTLNWHAVGDDGADGTAAAYEIRYSLAAITEANWASALSAADPPVPQPSGALEVFDLTGLAPGTTYYVRIRTWDDEGNSALSNEASATTEVSGDHTPPAAITDLKARGVNGRSGAPVAVKAYRASSQYKSNKSKAALDGRGSTFWKSRIYRKSHEEYLILDLLGTRTINEVRMQAPASVSAPFPKSYRVEISRNRKEWTTLASENGGKVKPGEWVDLEFAKAQGRWLRIYVKQTGTAPKYPTRYCAAIAEIEVYEESATPTSRVQLTWTAPGDDGRVGTAAAYDLRMLPAPITAAHFHEATPLAAPAPAPAGTSQAALVAGLTPGRRYWFAIETLDAAGNRSTISNVVSVTAPAER